MMKLSVASVVGMTMLVATHRLPAQEWQRSVHAIGYIHSDAPDQFGPRVFTSTGRHRLWVVPDTAEGATGAEYRLLDGRREVWRTTLWFVADAALVLDTGEVWVHAVTKPPVIPNQTIEQWLERAQRGDVSYEELAFMTELLKPYDVPTDSLRSGESFELVVFDPDGRVRMQEQSSREAFAGFVADDDPLRLLGLVAHREADRVIIRFRGDTDHLPEFWRVYTLAGADLFHTLALNLSDANRWPSAAQHLLEVDSIAGTDLFVVHWWQLGCAGHYTVVTADGEPIWTLEPDVRYPFDEQDGRPRAVNRMSLEEAKKHATLVGLKRPEQFSFLPFGENNYRTFSVTPAGLRAWRIEEVERLRAQEDPTRPNADADMSDDEIRDLLEGLQPDERALMLEKLHMRR